MATAAETVQQKYNIYGLLLRTVNNTENLFSN